MIAADTNVVVRLLTGDEPDQSARAHALFRSNEIWIAKTVLLETEWVLRSVYRFSPEETFEALRKLAGLPNVRLEDEAAVVQAIGRAQEGMDLADSLHLASREPGTEFVSFDERFAKRARRAGIEGVSAVV